MRFPATIRFVATGIAFSSREFTALVNPGLRCIMATSKPALSTKIGSQSPRIVGGTERQAFDDAIRRNVAERAFVLFEACGREHGNDQAHWLQAEKEVLQHQLEVRESGSWLAINGSIPDVTADDIEVCVEPNRVIIRARRDEPIQNAGSESQRSMQRELFLLRDLNTEVDPSTASASFKDEKLTLMVKKRYPVTNA